MIHAGNGTSMLSTTADSLLAAQHQKCTSLCCSIPVAAAPGAVAPRGGEDRRPRRRYIHVCCLLRPTPPEPLYSLSADFPLQSTHPCLAATNPLSSPRAPAAGCSLVGSGNLCSGCGVVGSPLGPRQNVADGLQLRSKRLQGGTHAGEARHEAAQIRRHLQAEC